MMPGKLAIMRGEVSLPWGVQLLGHGSCEPSSHQNRGEIDAEAALELSLALGRDRDGSRVLRAAQPAVLAHLPQQRDPELAGR